MDDGKAKMKPINGNHLMKNWIFLGFVLLLAPLVKSSATDQMLAPSGRMTPSVRLAETYTEKVAQTPSGQYYAARVTCATYVTILASMDGVSLPGIVAGSVVTCAIGNLHHSATLAESVEGISCVQKRKATFPLLDGNRRNYGSISYAWTSGTLTISITASSLSVSTGLVLAVDPTLYKGAVSGTLDANIRFGENSGLHAVTLRGASTTATHTGSPAAKWSVTLRTATIGGSADYFSGPQLRIASPGNLLVTTASSVKLAISTGTTATYVSSGLFGGYQADATAIVANRSWATTIALDPGWNRIEVRAYDKSNRVSVRDVNVRRYVASTLTIQTSGSGSVSGATFRAKISPNSTGTCTVAIGDPFTLTATPGPNFLFAGWTGTDGTVFSTGTIARFGMTQALHLTATFVPNKLRSVAGLYSATFKSDGSIAGGLTFSVGGAGLVTGTLNTLGGTFGFNGQCLANGHGNATMVTNSPVFPRLSLTFALDLNTSSGLVTGTVSGGYPTVSAAMIGSRCPFNAKNLLNPTVVGNHTSVFSFIDATSNPPIGGVGTLAVSSSGTVVFQGILDDGTSVVHFTASGPLGSGTVFRFSAPILPVIPDVATTVSGSLVFHNNGSTQFVGTATLSSYSRKSATLSQLDFHAIGSKYRSPAIGKHVLTRLDTNGGKASLDIASFSNGATQIASTITLSSAGVAAVANNVNGVRLSFDPKNGTFTGAFMHRYLKRLVPFQGVAFQAQGTAWGFYIVSSTDSYLEEGEITITPK